MEVLNYRDLPKFELETGFKKTSENYYPMEGSMLKITQKAWSYQISNLSSLLRLKQIADSCNKKYSVPILIMSCRYANTSARRFSKKNSDSNDI